MVMGSFFDLTKELINIFSEIFLTKAFTFKNIQHRIYYEKTLK
ncbi:hypothetical protein HMPREF0528_0844 [Lactobacillus johnsonii ATCC 33200]|uniref:Uncharacterized protein n=1 Tax=Lactobacillus johnsonii ATCC 33200 TaxID=525330 RepID=C2E520_LACJH|nr:hypothetical protein HMPREF0528_0844 [Lactobacillus johnsonii ATCC 33200]